MSRISNALDIESLQGTPIEERKQKPKESAVYHPSHYADKAIEVIDYIRDTLSPEGFVDYCGGNVLKYVSRWKKKGGVEDLEKAQVYLGWMIDAAKEIA